MAPLSENRLTTSPQEKIPMETRMTIYVSSTGNNAHMDPSCSGMIGPKKLMIQKELVPVIDWCKICAVHLRQDKRHK